MSGLFQAGRGAHTLWPCYPYPPIRLRFFPQCSLDNSNQILIGCFGQHGRSFFTTLLIHKTRINFNSIGRKPYPVTWNLLHIRSSRGGCRLISEPAALIRIVCFVTHSQIRNKEILGGGGGRCVRKCWMEGLLLYLWCNQCGEISRVNIPFCLIAGIWLMADCSSDRDHASPSGAVGFWVQAHVCITLGIL